MATLDFGPGVSELSSLKSVEDSDILGNTEVRALSVSSLKPGALLVFIA